MSKTGIWIAIIVLVIVGGIAYASYKYSENKNEAMMHSDTMMDSSSGAIMHDDITASSSGMMEDGSKIATDSPEMMHTSGMMQDSEMTR